MTSRRATSAKRAEMQSQLFQAFHSSFALGHRLLSHHKTRAYNILSQEGLVDLEKSEGEEARTQAS